MYPALHTFCYCNSANFSTVRSIKVFFFCFPSAGRTASENNDKGPIRPGLQLKSSRSGSFWKNTKISMWKWECCVCVCGRGSVHVCRLQNHCMDVSAFIESTNAWVWSHEPLGLADYYWSVSECVPSLGESSSPLRTHQDWWVLKSVFVFSPVRWSDFHIGTCQKTKKQPLDGYWPLTRNSEILESPDMIRRWSICHLFHTTA